MDLNKIHINVIYMHVIYLSQFRLNRFSSPNVGTCLKPRTIKFCPIVGQIHTMFPIAGFLLVWWSPPMDVNHGFKTTHLNTSMLTLKFHPCVWQFNQLGRVWNRKRIRNQCQFYHVLSPLYTYYTTCSFEENHLFYRYVPTSPWDFLVISNNSWKELARKSTSYTPTFILPIRVYMYNIYIYILYIYMY